MATSRHEKLKLASLPDNFNVTHVINANGSEFIVIPSELSNFNTYKYNTSTNSFNQFTAKLIKNVYGRVSIQVTFDEKKQIFYIRRVANMYSFDITTDTVKQLKHEMNNVYGGYVLFINNYLHVIKSHDRHWIRSIHPKNNIISNPTKQYSKEERQHGAAIYIPSKQSILLIGGYKAGQNLLPGDLWIYSLKTQKWNNINNISFSRYDFGYVLTSNQRYIILFGGWKHVSVSGDEEVDDIFVLDMKDDNNWKLKQCEIKCPVFGTCYGARTGGCDSNNQILVNGFVKKCFKLKEFLQLQLPPVYIINIINKYFSAEMIHCIEDKDHYGIYLKQILSSL